MRLLILTAAAILARTGVFPVEAFATGFLATVILSMVVLDRMKEVAEAEALLGVVPGRGKAEMLMLRVLTTGIRSMPRASLVDNMMMVLLRKISKG